ncbi:hypothetical protein [Kineosporia succinea]|uniref:Uncharacterized protein n=1 Tax=Kineosporia succinea TaxID=84632 RepID=A0ABT9P6X2_9ACTN|nr:hypothetical protein [Kineosporia succinea]MDP9828460.1 hypothetical protein [Kineosporia succinea]
MEPALHLPYAMGGEVAQLVGGMADLATDPRAVMPVLVDRAIEVMETAVRFTQLYPGELPRPDDHEQEDRTLERLAGAADDLGLDERDIQMLTQAWYSGNAWIQPVLFLCQRADVRTHLPQRERLTAAVGAVREIFGSAEWLFKLLVVLDDEPLIVLDRGFAGTGRGYRVRIGGIGDNFQLLTLLAAALIGDPAEGLLPGRAPSVVEVAAAGTGEDLQPDGGIRGSWNMVDANGEWIWNEGTPADIPCLDGVRVVVLEPEPYTRTWNTGRQYPLMAPLLRVEGLLPEDDVVAWLAKVK